MAEQPRKTSIAPPPEFDVPYTGKLTIGRTRSELAVGERGPAVFVPSVPGTVVPQFYEDPGQAMPAISPKRGFDEAVLAETRDTR
jgi:hypothetical protein